MIDSKSLVFHPNYMQWVLAKFRFAYKTQKHIFEVCFENGKDIITKNISFKYVTALP